MQNAEPKCDISAGVDLDQGRAPSLPLATILPSVRRRGGLRWDGSACRTVPPAAPVGSARRPPSVRSRKRLSGRDAQDNGGKAARDGEAQPRAAADRSCANCRAGLGDRALLRGLGLLVAEPSTEVIGHERRPSRTAGRALLQALEADRLESGGTLGLSRRGGFGSRLRTFRRVSTRSNHGTAAGRSGRSRGRPEGVDVRRRPDLLALAPVPAPGSRASP